MADKIKIKDSDALIVVDVQNDFCPGGSLAVAGGDEVIQVVNRLLDRFRTRVFTRDWHPPDHISFSDQPKFIDKSWPPHCVRGTPGAAFHRDLRVPSDAIIQNKATDKDREAYSSFQDSDLADKLRARGVDRVFLAGLATDYCVKNTALDALSSGFQTVVIEDAVRGIDVPPGSVDQAIEEMRSAGARLASSEDVE